MIELWNTQNWELKKISLKNLTSIHYILSMMLGFAQSQRSAEGLLILPNLLYNLDFCSLFPLEFHKEWVGNEHVFKEQTSLENSLASLQLPSTSSDI